MAKSKKAKARAGARKKTAAKGRHAPKVAAKGRAKTKAARPRQLELKAKLAKPLAKGAAPAKVAGKVPQRMDKAALKKLKAHLARERAAVRGEDVGARSFLLGDFHVCLAECLGNSLLADTLRDFTARTTLIAMLYQSSHDASKSCEEHVQIVAALEKGETAQAEKLMARHLRNVQEALKLQAGGEDDPLARLRDALAPVGAAQDLHTSSRKPGRKAASGSDDPSTYLGALL